MIKKLLHSFVPLLVGFILLSFFLIWSHFSIEEKSNRQLVVQIPKSAYAVEQGSDEVIRVLYPIFLINKGPSNQWETNKRNFIEEMKRLETAKDSYSLEEQNDLLAAMLFQNAYKEAKKIEPILLKNLKQKAPSPVTSSTIHYNLGILFLIGDEYQKSLLHLDQVDSIQNSYLKDLAKALVYLNLNRRDEGLLLIDRAFQAAPKDRWPYIHFKLANLYSSQEKHEQALIEIEKALNLNSEFYQATLNKAVIYRKLERFQEAERIYAELLTRYPSYFKGIYNYGILLEKVGRKPEAILIFKKALSLNSRHEELRINLAELLFADQNFSLALQHYRWLMKNSPGNWDYILKVAQVELKLGNFKEATRLMTYAIEKKGGNYPKGWMELGDAYLMMEKDKLALNAYENALRLEPKNKNTLGRLAKYYSRIKNSTKEVYYYQMALKSDPNNGLYLRRLGIAVLKQNKVKTAIKYLEESIKYINNPYRSYKYLAEAHEKLKNYTEASRYYQLALKLEPKDDMDWYHYGIILFKMKNYSESIIALKKAETYADQENHKFIALIKRRLANVFVKTKKFTPAIETFKEALELDSGSFSVRLDYAKMLLRLKGRKNQGRDELKLALNLRPHNCRALKLAIKYSLDNYKEKWKSLCTQK